MARCLHHHPFTTSALNSARSARAAWRSSAYRFSSPLAAPRRRLSSLLFSTDEAGRRRVCLVLVGAEIDQHLVKFLVGCSHGPILSPEELQDDVPIARTMMW